jgi:hypothetical protein
VVAALLTLIVNATPAPGVLAPLSALADSAPVEAILPDVDPSAPTIADLPLTTAVALDSPDLHDLPATPAEARALDVAVSGAPVALTASEAPAPPAAAAQPAPAAAQPAAPRAAVRAATRPAKLWSQLRRGLTVRGAATWYFGTRGYAGIAHVAMPGARYLPRGANGPRARVCAGGRCVTVRVVDSCGCRAGTRKARVADLSVATLRRLGLDPRRGVYQVRVTLIAP